MAFSKARRLADLMSAASASVHATKRGLADDSVTAAMIADNVIDIARLNVSDGANGQFRRTNGRGTVSFASLA